MNIPLTSLFKTLRLYKFVLAGSHHNKDVNADIVPIEKLISHPDAVPHSGNKTQWYWKGNGGVLNDLSLIVLARPVKISTHIQPICLPSIPDQEMSDMILYVSGWGDTKLRKAGQYGESYGVSPVPKRTSVTVVSEAECKRNHAAINCNECGYPGMICAYGTNKYNETVADDACIGDSGGW